MTDKILLSPIDLDELVLRIGDYLLEKMKPENNNDQKLLSREDCAKKLGVSAETVSNWLKEGKLINVGIGRKILIPEESLCSPGLKKYKR